MSATALSGAPVSSPALPRTVKGVVRDYLELSKSRIVMMVLITTAAGFLATARPFNVLLLVHTLVGTALVAAGTNALNQYAEREHDARRLIATTGHRFFLKWIVYAPAPPIAILPEIIFIAKLAAFAVAVRFAGPTNRR